MDCCHFNICPTFTVQNVYFRFYFILLYENPFSARIPQIDLDYFTIISEG